MKRSIAVAGTIGTVIWILVWGRRGAGLSASVLLHWPLIPILLWGFTNDLRGGLIAALTATIYAVILAAIGAVDSWTLTAWQLLVYGVFGLYPFKFMQIREQRRSHYLTLLEYKRGETDALQNKLSDIEEKCNEIEQKVRMWSSAGQGGGK